jgi:hypothetical protein
MIHETVQAKAVRHLSEARLTVTRVDGDHVTAVCRGDGELHHLGHDLGRGWWCLCPARTDHCAHLVALRLVVVRRQQRPQGSPKMAATPTRARARARAEP